MSSSRRVLLLRLVLVSLAFVAVLPESASSQLPTGRQWGGRLDAIGSRAPSAQAGVAMNATAGLYVRLEATVAAGVAVEHGSVRGAGRGDALVRFLLDPFAESAHALYGLGGVSLMYDGFERWRPRVVAGVGIEGPRTRGRVTALELALGGGARVGIVVRRARARGR